MDKFSYTHDCGYCASSWSVEFDTLAGLVDYAAKHEKRRLCPTCLDAVRTKEAEIHAGFCIRVRSSDGTYYHERIFSNPVNNELFWGKEETISDDLADRGLKIIEHYYVELANRGWHPDDPLDTRDLTDPETVWKLWVKSLDGWYDERKAFTIARYMRRLAKFFTAEELERLIVSVREPANWNDMYDRPFWSRCGLAPLKNGTYSQRYTRRGRMYDWRGNEITKRELPDATEFRIEREQVSKMDLDEHDPEYIPF